jgi:hypothetical protein
MIQTIPDFPDNVVAVTASGEIDADDYANIIAPAVERARQKYDKIRMLYHVESNLRDYTPGALMGDAKLGLKQLTHFEKIAIVTDNKVIASTVKPLGFLMPGKVRVFPNAELEEAKTWIVE